MDVTYTPGFQTIVVNIGECMRQYNLDRCAVRDGVLTVRSCFCEVLSHKLKSCLFLSNMYDQDPEASRSFTPHP